MDRWVRELEGLGKRCCLLADGCWDVCWMLLKDVRDKGLSLGDWWYDFIDVKACFMEVCFVRFG